MPIGEFGGAPPLVGEGSPALTTPMYWMYELAQSSLNPARAVTDATKILFQNPLNPWSHTEFGKSIAHRLVGDNALGAVEALGDGADLVPERHGVGIERCEIVRLVAELDHGFGQILDTGAAAGPVIALERLGLQFGAELPDCREFGIGVDAVARVARAAEMRTSDRVT